MKKNSIKIAIMLVIVFTFSNIYAATITSTNFNVYVDYDFLINGESLTIPESITYNAGTGDYSLDLSSFITRIKTQAANTNALDFDTNTNALSLTGNGVILSTVSNDSTLILDDSGCIVDSLDTEALERYFYTSYLLNYKQTYLESYKEKLEALEDTEENETLKAQYELYISNYTDDIEILKQVDSSDVTGTTKEIISNISYVVKQIKVSHSADLNEETLTESYTVNYYVYSIICRDLRLSSLNYMIGDTEYSMSDFDKDTYTYNVTLPATTDESSTIKLSSQLYMYQVLEQNGMADYEFDDISVSTTDATLKDGKGSAVVTVTFDMSKYGEKGKTSTLSYTVNFTVSDYDKGDMNLDGKVNAEDAAIVLDRYKNNDATDEDYLRGDMNEDGRLNAEDAAMILDVYKNS